MSEALKSTNAQRLAVRLRQIEEFMRDEGLSIGDKADWPTLSEAADMIEKLLAACKAFVAAENHDGMQLAYTMARAAIADVEGKS